MLFKGGAGCFNFFEFYVIRVFEFGIVSSQSNTKVSSSSLCPRILKLKWGCIFLLLLKTFGSLYRLLPSFCPISVVPTE